MAMIRRYCVDKSADVNQTSPDLNISRRLIQSDFLRDNLAAGGFTKYGSGTASMNTSILNRIKSLGGPGMARTYLQLPLWQWGAGNVYLLPPVDLHWFFEISIRTEKKFQLELKKKIQL